ncbi:MAG: hypothetical protein JNK74_30180 [Candidatus Hydrogenedentes bacterium]|nr:hypothetical protein [Candidatus Hydrogenedentota bacterium]
MQSRAWWQNNYTAATFEQSLLLTLTLTLTTTIITIVNIIAISSNINLKLWACLVGAGLLKVQQPIQQ